MHLSGVLPHRKYLCCATSLRSIITMCVTNAYLLQTGMPDDRSRYFPVSKQEIYRIFRAAMTGLILTQD
jgi:hypothetical protein